ncbi:Uncharacterised protein [Burkholderia pseudomallei]|nr:Uncharacterised protein [Burkholderia pseudomallei]
MKDATHGAIDDALNRLASKQPSRTNGKVTGINVAYEAGIAKATLYRYFDSHPGLRDKYNTLRKGGIDATKIASDAQSPSTGPSREDAETLRKALAEAERAAEKSRQLLAHQVELLWLDNERLRQEVLNLTAQVDAMQNVVPLGRS